MKFSPRHTQIIGRMVIRKQPSTIIRPDESKVSKFVLVDAVGAEAAEQGISVGDVVVPNALGNIMLDGSFRPVLEEKNVAFIVIDVSVNDLLVQTDNGAKFVPFDSPEAALSVGSSGRWSQPRTEPARAEA